MKPIHDTRPITFFILGLILVIFLTGTLRAFTSARAAFLPAEGASAVAATVTGLSPTFTPSLAPGNTGQTPGASPVPTAGPSETPLPTPEPAETVTATPTPPIASADTTGIIALAIVVVVITLIGMAWGARSFRVK